MINNLIMSVGIAILMLGAYFYGRYTEAKRQRIAAARAVDWLTDIEEAQHDYVDGGLKTLSIILNTEDKQ